MTRPTGDDMRRLLALLAVGLLSLAIGILTWKLLLVTPEILSPSGPPEATVRTETVATKIYVPLLQTLVTALFGLTFIKGALTIAANQIHAAKGESLESIRFFSW